MFEKYFIEQSKFLSEALKRRIEQKEIGPADKKDIKLFKEFYDFIKDHLLTGYSLAIGKVRNRSYGYNVSCDLIVYRKWCKSLLKLTNGYIMVDDIYLFMSIENDLSTEALLRHVEMTRTIKTMYIMDHPEFEEKVIPVYSVLFAYKSRVPLLSHKISMINASSEKDIPLNQQVDLIAILDQGIIIKDWENGIFRIIETKEDTLMWFYILFTEFIDRENQFRLDLRSYIKNVKEYAEK